MRADPAGALVYPGATLTSTSDASYLSEFTRTYSLTTSATAKQIRTDPTREPSRGCRG